MKENYLHNKVREQQSQINRLMDLNEELQDKIKRLPSKEDLNKFYEEHHLSQIKTVLETKSLIKPIFIKLFNESISDNIKMLKSNICSEAKRLNKYLSKRIIDNVEQQRKVNNYLQSNLIGLMTILDSEGIIKKECFDKLTETYKKLKNRGEMK